MSVLSIFFIILSSVLLVIVLITYRLYYHTHSKEEEKEKIPGEPLENPDEIKRKESFRQLLKSFLQKY